MSEETPIAAPTVTTEAPVTITAIPVTPILTPPVDAPQTVPEAISVEAPKVETTAPVTTVLGEGPKEPIPTETPEVKEAPEAPKEAEKAQSDEPAPAPVFEKFVTPENIKLDEQRTKEFTDILSELEVKSKAEHALVQEFGQKAVDFHLQEVQKAQTDLVQFYQKEWDNQKVKWKNDFLADPDIGGNRMQTTVDSALSFIRTHGGNAEQQTELRALMDSSGLGNNKAIIRLFANAGKAMSEGKPLAASVPIPQSKTKTETLYGKSK